ncbi:hypothetical protein Poli38472_010108 [Pythium oligandrum]|uniref:Uncharacterized protein n=1 Tax=Pythium oligandrum TaxID=41045 RepID=A0A8K1C8R6_PYTOL|nr:hypothetical protein Poli38472_010108 [Pythium oligandrum]|eukprot:TMW58549.1 hypothetical protein Poli38472_010108 [Pythium oligandrum]
MSVVSLFEAEWVLSELSPLLTHEDAICMALVAIECGLTSLRHALLFKSLPIAAISTEELANYAAERGWWSLLARVLDKDRLTRPKRPSGADKSVLEQCKRYRPRDFREEVMFAAVRRGVFEEVKWLHRFKRQYYKIKAIELAAEARHLRILLWLLDRHGYTQHRAHIRLQLDDSDWEAVCWQGEGRICCAVSDQGMLPYYYCSPYMQLYPLMNLAAQQGNLKLLQKLHQDPVGTTLYSYWGMCSAAKQGHMEIVRWLHDHRTEHLDSVSQMLTAAVEGDQLAVLDWLHAHFDITRLIRIGYETAVRNDLLNVIRWFIENFRDTVSLLHPPRLFRLCSGPVDLIQLVCDVHRLKVNVTTVFSAASRGNVEVTKWFLNLDKQGQVDRKTLLTTVVQSGNMELLRWCIEAVGMWTKTAAKTAAYHGNLPMTKYLYEKSEGRPNEERIDHDEVLMAAIRSGSLEMVQWCVEEHDAWGVGVLGRAVWDGNLPVFKYLMGKSTERGGSDEMVPQKSISHHTVLKLVRDDKFEEERIEWILAHWLDSETQESKPPIEWSDPVSWRLMRCLLQYRPAICCRMINFPVWAVRYGTLADLERLKAIQHPELFTKTTLTAMLDFSRYETTMRWFLTHFGLKLSNLRMIKWAAKYAAIHVLELLQETMVMNPLQTQSNMDEDEVKLKFLGSVVWGAVRHDQVAALRWIDHQTCSRQVISRLWTLKLAKLSIQFGSSNSLFWLCTNNKIRSDDLSELKEMAVEYGQPRCLLSGTLNPGRFGFDGKC